MRFFNLKTGRDPVCIILITKGKMVSWVLQ